MKRSVVIILCVLGVLATAVLLRYCLRSDASPRARRTCIVEERPVARMVRQRGILESADETPAVVQTHGYIREIVSQGTPVKAGDLIFSMDDTQAQEDAEEARNRIERDRINRQITEMNLQLARFRENEELALLAEEREHAELAETEEGAKPDSDELRLLAIDVRLSELALADARDEYERNLRMFRKEFISQSALEPFERRVTVAEASLKEARIRYEFKKKGITEERRIELRRGVERARALEDRGRRSMERRLREIEERLAVSDRRLEQQQKSLARAEEEIRDAAVYATRDGIVEVGTYTDWRSGGRKTEFQPGVEKWPRDIVAHVINPEVMKTRLVVNEADFHELRTGMSVRLSMPAFPGRVFHGSLQQLGAIGRDRNRIDPTSSDGGPSDVMMFNAEISFDGQGCSFHPGMSAMVEIVVEEETVRLVAPREAIRMAPDGTARALRLGDSGTSEWVPVEGRAFNEHDFLVTGGLSAGDRLAVPDGKDSDARR